MNKAMLIILDGWGLGQTPEADAIATAHTPIFDQLWQQYPHTTLVTYGEEVGLPDGQMGNSEVGHLNIGAGRIVYQELARINHAIRTGSFKQNQILQDALSQCADGNHALHLIGLVSDGGVHSHIDHLKALVEAAELHHCQRVFIHAFMDGRDVDPKSGKGFLQDLQSFLQPTHAKIASVIGRYYAMDRDRRWERIRKAYQLLIHGEGTASIDPVQAVEDQYAAGITDEFLEPIVLTDEQENPLGLISSGDTVLFFNFRTDRPRQLTQVLTQSQPEGTDMRPLPLHFYTMTRYSDDFKGIGVLYEKDDIKNTLGEWLSAHQKTQLRIAETEKYPHVTFFFSGGLEDAFEGEQRILIHSPKVATYDLQPEMSAYLVKDAVIEQIQSEEPPDFIVLNFANTDMVGHTGVFKAGQHAAEAVDRCLGEILPAALSQNYRLLIIADHGNADFMINTDGSPNTAHSKNPVPCIYVSHPIDATIQLKPGKLADVAPTLLSMMEIAAPEEMTGDSLLTNS